ncbi:MAG TPA: hypothetical protein VHA33_02375 [Candidatus Angelobacter sp.]|jgi:hypothetical protein|nr:hypothetical protein [Candidatus Angelobacter sp.]
MAKSRRLGVALALYAALGVLIWTTMSDVPVRIAGGSISIRALPLIVLAFFAVRTFLHWKAEHIRTEREKTEETVLR